MGEKGQRGRGGGLCSGPLVNNVIGQQVAHYE